MLYAAVVASGPPLIVTLYYNRRIMYKHAVALKALNSKDLKREDIIFLPTLLELKFIITSLCKRIFR